MNQQQRLQLAQKAEEIATLRATLLAPLRRRRGIVALRANARLLLERLRFLIRLRRAAYLGPHLVAICGDLVAICADLVELRLELRRLRLGRFREI